jgi:hypothetical protein
MLGCVRVRPGNGMVVRSIMMHGYDVPLVKNKARAKAECGAFRPAE